MKIYHRSAWIAGIALVLSLGYSNCGRVGPADVLTASTLGRDICSERLKLEYKETYFPFLSTTCHSCHGNAHGSSDLNTSFNSFLSRSIATIDYKAVTAHGGNSFSAAVNQPILDSFKPRYAVANDDYMSCKARIGSGSFYDIRLLSQAIPNLPTPAGADDGWVEMTWDVETQAKDPALGKRLKSIFKIQIRRYMNQGQTIGAQFRNPRLTLINGQTAVKVSGLRLYVDEKWMDQITTYDHLDVNVEVGAERPLADGLSAAVLVMNPLPSAPVLAVEFRGVGAPNGTVNETPAPEIGNEDGTPKPVTVTYAQLMSSGNTMGVFANHCIVCHNSSTASGSLNLTNYNAARAAINSINSRMNDAGRPMPPAGILSANLREYVGIWVDNGGPQ